jgi:lia operon protein LiaG
MKKILFLLLAITGVYVLFVQPNVSAWWPMGSSKTEAAVTKGIDTIEIDVAGAYTTIIPDNENTLRAELEGKGKVSVKKSGNTISVHFKRNWFEGLPFFNNKSELTIYIPEEYNRDLELEIGSGSVNFSGDNMELDEFTLEIGSGHAEIKNLSTKLFNQEVSSGEVQVDSVTTKKGDIDVSSGHAEIKNYRGGLEAEISSGKLDIQMDELIGDIEMEISSGSASLDLPKDADFTLVSDVSSGDVNTEFPLDEMNSENNSSKGKHGTGKYKLNIDVSSGEVEIY